MEKKLRQISLFLGDVCLAFIALILTVILSFWNNFNWQIFLQHLLPFSTLYFFWFISFYIFGLYDLNSIKPSTELLARIGQCFLICLATGITFFYLIPFFGITPKTNLLINIIILAVFVFLWRKIFYHLFSSYYRQNVIFLEKNSLTNLLIEKIKSHPQLGYKFVGFLNPLKPFFSQLKNKKVDKIILAQDSNLDKKISQELYKSIALKIDFVDIFYAYETIFHEIPIDFLNQAWFLKNLKENEKKFYDKIKKIADVILSLFLSIILLPFFIIIATLIKLTSPDEPIIYSQTRIGKGGRKFTLYKFCTMIPNAETKGPQWATRNDPRITKIGKFLRRTHLDEIPQLINILKGNLALVGPRPERPEFIEKLKKKISYYEIRHLIKPGLTGWAQINYHYGASIEDAQKKLCYELYYIKNRSFFLDLGIIFKTFQHFFKGV